MYHSVMKVRTRVFPVLAIVLFACCAPLQVFARDFPEPVLGFLMRSSSDGDQSSIAARNALFQPGGPVAAYTSFTAQAFRTSQHDQFQIRQWVNAAVLTVGPVTLTANYGSYLMNGPPFDDQTPGSRLPWIMNAIQFEYGLVAQVSAGKMTISAEYARRSQHPMARGHDETGVDIVRLGWAPPSLTLQPPVPLTRFVQPLHVHSLVRFGYSKLWDLWDAPTLTGPRHPWSTILQSEAYVPISGARSQPRSALFVSGTVEVMYTYGKSVEADRWLELGLRWGVGPGAVEFYLDHFGSADTEATEDGPDPANLWGYGIRLRSVP